MYESAGIIHEILRKKLCILFYKKRVFWYISRGENMTVGMRAGGMKYYEVKQA